MRAIRYLQYFFYLGINWNFKIAYHILLHEIKGEHKYGIDTTGSDELHKIKAAGTDISHATIYMPASYILLKDVFKQLPANPSKHFVDIGCGKGRVLCVAAQHGFNKVTGVDFSKEFCANATDNLTITKKKFPSFSFSVINKDASLFDIPDDADCIFFFNPFDLFIMNKVAKKIKESYHRKPRTIYIIYLNPLYKNELLNIGFKEIYYTIKMQYMEAVILKITA